MVADCRCVSAKVTGEIEKLRHVAESRIGVPAPLHGYQWEGVSFLFRSPGALLADEMGLGKTVQAAVALALLLETSSDVDRVLIVAPASLTLNWMAELSIWAPGIAARRLEGDAHDRDALYALPVPVLVGSYEQVRSDGIDRIPSGTFDLVVLDEAQRIKDRDSATSLACRLLPRSRSWALSATPLENNLNDVATILGFLDPGFGPHPTRGGIARKLEESMLRRRKRDVRSELPPVIVQDMQLELAGRQRARYEALWATRDSYVGRREGAEGAAMLGLITRLKGICNQDIQSGRSAKLEALETVVDSAGTTARIIVFSQFVKTLEWLAERLSIKHELVVGSMDMEERRAVMERFRTEVTPRALLVSLRAGGVGLNLGEASHVVLFDRWWNPAVENQAIYRAHRFDRSEPLHVVRFVVRDSIEERIALILDEKAELFDDVVEGARSHSRGFGRAELARILGLEENDSAT
ncbi:MAG: DEAD/DEAH box helicase [Acidobacteria bacterium]|nr:DEAD/DEAH box helicase [Acidobacteriota bacterium]